MFELFLQAVLHKMDHLKSKAKEIPETNNKVNNCAVLPWSHNSVLCYHGHRTLCCVTMVTELCAVLPW